MMGNHDGSYPSYSKTSLLQEFEDILSKPTEDPNLDSDASTSVYALMAADQPDSEVTLEVIGSLESDNDLPPYDADDIMGAGTAGTGRPSSPWVARTCMIKGGGSTSSPVAAVGGFAAPCGLLMIETNAGDDNSIGCTIEMVPGEYKGVHAYPMRGGGF